MAFRCTSCGEVIGVYEPTVIVDKLGVRDTSLAADPDIDVEPGSAFYHRSCYAAKNDQPRGHER